MDKVIMICKDREGVIACTDNVGFADSFIRYLTERDKANGIDEERYYQMDPIPFLPSTMSLYSALKEMKEI